MRPGPGAGGRWLQRLGGRCERRDRGVATVWAAMTTATLCAVFAVVLALGQVVVARHRAGGAADLAALAAADRALEGAATACRAAQEVAMEQGAEVVRCTVQGETADVAARVHLGPYAPEVRSRAGPAAAAADPARPATAAADADRPVTTAADPARPAAAAAGPAGSVPTTAPVRPKESARSLPSARLGQGVRIGGAR